MGVTRIHIGMEDGCCGNVSSMSDNLDGVLCCKSGSTEQQAGVFGNTEQQKDVWQPEAVGRTLSPIQLTTYGWVYVFSST